MSTTEDREDLVVYELGYLLLSSIPEDKLEGAVQNLKKIVTNAGGNLLDGEEPIIIDLAYKISKVVGSVKHVASEAYIGWFKFEAEPSQVPGIDTALKAVDEVLRFLLVKAPRETTFTFAQAMDALKKAESAEDAPVREEEVPAAATPEVKEAEVIAPTE